MALSQSRGGLLMLELAVIAGSKRGSRDLRVGGGEKITRLRGTAWRVERVCGACLEGREGWALWKSLRDLEGRPSSLDVDL